MSNHALVRAALSALCGVAWLGSADATAQTAPLRSHLADVRVDSGDVENLGTAPAVVFSTTIEVPGAAWLRLMFDDLRLAGRPGNGTSSYLIITSLLDGKHQRLDTVSAAQWQKTSAYFNGDAVELALIAQPGTGRNRVALSTVIAGERGADGERSICGTTDDRVLSDDPRAGRLQPGGCTGWIINDCAHCMLTAGHCSDSNNVLEFNVPLSDPDGSLNHPGPEDQYAIDPASVQSNGGQGVGNDWAYFGCFANSNTGLTAYEAQGAAFTVVLPPPVETNHIRITGYGTVSSPVPLTWNQVQKTHLGPFTSFTGTALGYRTDTTGGNSGSPVIWEETGNAIGIHTHGGCTASGGENHGTGANHAALQAALASPTGICICYEGILVTPLEGFESSGNPGGPFSPDTYAYTVKNVDDTPLDYSVTNTQVWLSLSGASGTLYSGEEVDVYLTINSNANTLPPGVYTDTLTFTNLTDHVGDTTRLVTLQVGGPQVIYAWNLDTNPGWTTQSQWAWGTPTGGSGDHGLPDPTSGHTGTKVYGYNLAGGYTDLMTEQHLTTTAINCADLTQVKLRFWRWLGVESSTYDHAYVRVSNNGTTWTTIWQNPSSTLDDGAWVRQDFDISPYADNKPTVYIRWTMGTTDGSWTFCGWNIDDIEIWAVPPCTAPWIIMQPQSLARTAGQAATFEVVADGTAPLAFQWRKDGAEIDGANESTYTLAAVTLADAGQYDCVVSNDCGVLPSALATLTVWPVGDLNCDTAVDFGDINAFVAFVSDCVTWQAAYPNCLPTNGDIDGDGQHACNGAPFDDINAFVALLTGG